MLQGGAKKLMSFHIDSLIDRNLREKETGSKTRGAWAWTSKQPSLYESCNVPACFRKISLTTISRMIWRGRRRKES